jgi:hypothetical protein
MMDALLVSVGRYRRYLETVVDSRIVYSAPSSVPSALSCYDCSTATRCRFSYHRHHPEATSWLALTNGS